MPPRGEARCRAGRAGGPAGRRRGPAERGGRDRAGGAGAADSPPLRASFGPAAALAALVVTVLGIRYAGHSGPGRAEARIRAAFVRRGGGAAVAAARRGHGLPGRARGGGDAGRGRGDGLPAGPVVSGGGAHGGRRGAGRGGDDAAQAGGGTHHQRRASVLSERAHRLRHRTGPGRGAACGRPARSGQGGGSAPGVHRGRWPAVPPWAGLRSPWVRTIRPTPSAAGAPRWR